MATRKKKVPRVGSLRVRGGDVEELAWVCVGASRRGCGGGARVKKTPTKRKKTITKRKTKRKARKGRDAKGRFVRAR